MSTAEESAEREETARPAFSVHRGSPVGDALRRHWVPVLPIDVLERQNARRVRLLGEDRVIYRDRAGRYGLLGDRCPHRGVSLEWGVAADVGLRCPYHGWCFDQSGQCVDIPLQGLITRDYVHIPADPLQVHGGVLWSYLGEGEAPAFPDLGAFGDPGILRHLVFTVADRNWLDVIESWSDEPTHVGSPFAFLDGEREVAVAPLDDLATLVIVAERLGPLPVALAEASPTTDLSDGALSPADGPMPAAAAAPGARARRWLHTTLALAVTDGEGTRAGAPVDLTTGDREGGPIGDLARAMGLLAGRDLDLVGLDPAIADLPELAAHRDRLWVLDLLVRAHLPLWLDALGAPAVATAIRELSPLTDTAGDEVLALVTEAEKTALEAFDRAFTETQREPWKLVWPYVWNAESSARWARGRDRAVAAAWRLDWQSAAGAIATSGAGLLAAAAGTAEGALAVRALSALELAARALCWPGAWAHTWSEIVAEVREEAPEAPEVDAPEQQLSATRDAAVAATRAALDDERGSSKVTTSRR